MDRLTIEFIEKSKEKFGEQFDYSEVVYVNSKTKVKLTCKQCGNTFDVIPYAHLHSKGCPWCNGLKQLTTEEFIKRSKEVHGDKYTYEKTKYVNKRTNVIITCPIHGDFSQNPHNHISQKQGCPECGKEKAQSRVGDYVNSRKTETEFGEEIKTLYKGQYTVLGEYVNNKTYLDLYCHKIGTNGKEHGVFRTRPDWLLRGHGCPICGYKKSAPEVEIRDFIKEHYDGIVEEHNRQILKGKEIDLYLPELKLGVEFNGLRWHSELYAEKKSLKNKTDECEKMGIHLVNIFEDEWNNKQDICKSRLLNFLKKSDRIYARKCTISEITGKEANLFVSENHIQGCANAKYNIALKYNDEIVAVMTFGNLRKNLGRDKKEGCYELLRFCNKKNMTVIGGASRLLKYFIKEHNPEYILSFADRRWSDGNLYESLGFTLEGFTSPNYSYINKSRKERINRFSLRKDVLKSKYGCPDEKSEHQFCMENGLYRIYDCGNRKYIWNNKK